MDYWCNGLTLSEVLGRHICWCSSQQRHKSEPLTESEKVDTIITKEPEYLLLQINIGKLIEK